MYKCDQCQTTFNGKRQLAGHKRVHSEKFLRNAEATKLKSFEERHRVSIENYYRNPVVCKVCNMVVPYDKKGGSGKTRKAFCSHSCSAKFSNQARMDRGFELSEESRKKTSETLKKGHLTGRIDSSRRNYKSLKIAKIPSKVYNVKRPKQCRKCLFMLARPATECVICHKLYAAKTDKSKVCSTECISQFNSVRRSKWLIKNGTTNSWTKRRRFSHNGTEIECDSKLEEAALIFLSEKHNIPFLARFKSIICFKDPEGTTRRYNPDFITKIDGKTTVVEVKMLWKNKSKPENNYTRHFDLKVAALQKFCDERHYGCMVLNVAEDKEFSKVYRKHLKQYAILTPV